MKPKLEHILELMLNNNWSGADLARHAGVSRSEANRFLSGQRKGGNKMISGLLRAFPGETLDTLFILPSMYPNVNTDDNIVPYKKGNILSGPDPPLENFMHPVKHPKGSELSCCYNEEYGIIEISKGQNLTILHVPVGHISYEFLTREPHNTS
jgi:transcriptional regulator with XRE-family HTH domain